MILHFFGCGCLAVRSPVSQAEIPVPEACKHHGARVESTLCRDFGFIVLQGQPGCRRYAWIPQLCGWGMHVPPEFFAKIEGDLLVLQDRTIANAANLVSIGS